jgi:hypothetical protein
MPTSDIKKGPLYVDSTNNRVGIGTSSPSVKLEIKAGNGNQLVLDNAGETYTQIGFKTGGTARGTIWASATDFSMYTYSTQPIIFHTNTAERMRIDSGGNVGIGTSNTTAGKTTINLTGVAVAGDTDGATIGSSGIINLYNSNQATNSTVMLLGGGSDSTVGQIASGIGFSRENSADWGTQLRFYTHSIATSDLDELKERMRIDSGGRVTMPYQPSFAATRNQGDVTNAVYVYPNVYHNTGNHYNNSNGRFTAPVTGSYFISANHMTSNGATYNNYEYQIRINGSVHQLAYSSSGGNVHHSWNWHGVIHLQAGDYIDVFIPSGFSIYGQSNLYQHFSGYLIG